MSSPVSQCVSYAELLRITNAGFWASRALSAALELRVLDAIDERNKSAYDLSAKLGVNQRGLEVLLRFLHAWGLIDVAEDGGVMRTDRTALLDSSDGVCREELLVANRVWRSFEDLTSKVVSGPETDSSEFFESLDHSELVGFLNTMDYQGRRAAEIIATTVNLQHCRLLLDVGCGLGTYSISLLNRNPHLRAVLLDSPRVIDLARPHMRRVGLENRATLVAADFWTTQFMQPADVVLFSRILHDWSDEQAFQLVRRLVKYIPIGGQVLVHEEIIENARAPELWPVLMDLFLFAALGCGKTRTVEELTRLLLRCGCSVKHMHRIDNRTFLLVASKHCNESE